MTKEQRGNEDSESVDSKHADDADEDRKTQAESEDSPTRRGTGLKTRAESGDSPTTREIGLQRPPPTVNVSSWRRMRTWCTCIGCILTAALAIILSSPYIQGTLLSSDGYSLGQSDDKVKSYVTVWQNNYPNQNSETWGTIAGQLSEFAAIGHTSPLVIVMAYDKGQKTTKMLASEISRAALLLINDPDKCGDTDAAKLSGSDKRIKPEFLLNESLQQLVKCRKMIMFDLQELDGSAAKDLHSLIDPDHPNIPNVVYIFTVKISNFEGNVYHEVRNTLTTNWSAKMDDNRLNALLSRLVNNVKIIPESVFE